MDEEQRRALSKSSVLLICRPQEDNGRSSTEVQGLLKWFEVRRDQATQIRGNLASRMATRDAREKTRSPSECRAKFDKVDDAQKCSIRIQKRTGYWPGLGPVFSRCRLASVVYKVDNYRRCRFAALLPRYTPQGQAQERKGMHVRSMINGAGIAAAGYGEQVTTTKPTQHGGYPGAAVRKSPRREPMGSWGGTTSSVSITVINSCTTYRASDNAHWTAHRR